LFDYWNARRGHRRAPERGEIEPAPIRHVLADAFILAFDTASGHPFRLAGTRVCAAFGRELKGEAFMALWNVAGREAVRDLLSVVAHETVGAVAGVSGRGSDGAALEFELVILPLRHRGRTDARLLGALAPVEVPDWLGASALAELTLGTLRYVGSVEREHARSHIVAPMPIGRTRYGLTVYDGGRS
jgi:hypothetical protein